MQRKNLWSEDDRERQDGCRLKFVAAILWFITVTCLAAGCALDGAQGGTNSEAAENWWTTTKYSRHDDDSDAIIDSYRLATPLVSVVAIDSNDDGMLDEWMILSKTGTEFHVKDRNGDGELDWWYEETGIATGRMALDNDYDGLVDEQKNVEIRR